MFSLVRSMRWFLIDRFTEFVSGEYAVAQRSISLSEEAVDDYVPGFPTYPSSLIVEGMAQTGGILGTQIGDFEHRMVVAKIMKLKLHTEATPGDLLTLRADLQTQTPDGAVVRGTVHRGNFLFAEMEQIGWADCVWSGVVRRVCWLLQIGIRFHCWH